ncbi:AAEL000336-PA [Aedes aegypti]|nr:AAEL000336-PA [Aedes aegypti]
MGDSTPICRCRVLYLGSAVPRQSKDGLQGIQEPLRSLYPSEGAIGAKGIDSWLSVWSNGILLENVDENRKQVTRFFPIDSLHYCAAVRQVLIPERGNNNPEPKFLPLDSPFARTPRAQHPPIFAAILRRTTGIKVLECHTFICKREAAANALVRCCFHAYADNSYARQLEGSGSGSSNSVYGTIGGKSNGTAEGAWRSRAGSTTTLNSVGVNSRQAINGVGEAYTVKNLYASSADLEVVDDGDGSSLYNGDENHKIWSGSTDQLDGIGVGDSGHYDIYSGTGSTLGRPARARQISAPVPVPPPPKEELKKLKKEAKKQSKHQLQVGSQSLSGTLIRPRPMHMNPLGRPGPPPPGGPGGHPGMMMYTMGPPPPPPLGGRQFHTIGHRSHNGTGMPPMMHHPHHQIPMHPGMPPMQMMVPPQYATLQHPRSSKKKKDKNKMNGGIPIGVPVVPPMFAYPPPPGPASLMEPRPLSMSNRKLAQSAAAGLDESGNSGAESPGGTGIYRRKGHLNERAFSYSIRQEHRSRSHGSLASLQFNPPDMKKEREIAQMVAGLELTDDSTLQRRRSEVMAGSSGTFGKPRR